MQPRSQKRIACKPQQTIQSRKQIETLAVAVKTFTPTTLKTFHKNAENPLNVHCTARMLRKSGLIQQEDIIKKLYVQSVACWPSGSRGSKDCKRMIAAGRKVSAMSCKT